MAWQDYRNITDPEIELLRQHEAGRYPGFNEACELALKKNARAELHAASRDICAAHFASLVARASLQDAEGYEVTNKALGIVSAAWKELVRKSFAQPRGIMHKGQRLFFK